MDSINVLDIFNTSVGTIAILIFPENEYPVAGMIVERQDGATWKITDTAMPMHTEMTEGYEHIEPDAVLFSCKVEEQTPGCILEAGDILFKM